jgi:CheY-like chemotaxis protein
MEPTFGVLLIEDNDDDRAIFARLLTQAQRKVTEAATLADALQRLSAGGVDVVLLDLHLPDSTGVEGLRRLSVAHPELPIVVLTGLDDEAVGLRAVQEGAQDYLVKGQVDRKLLDRSLRYAIERKRAERTLAHLAAVVAGMCHECGRKLAPEGLRSFDN